MDKKAMRGGTGPPASGEESEVLPLAGFVGLPKASAFESKFPAFVDFADIALTEVQVAPIFDMQLPPLLEVAELPILEVPLEDLIAELGLPMAEEVLEEEAATDDEGGGDKDKGKGTGSGTTETAPRPRSLRSAPFTSEQIQARTVAFETTVTRIIEQLGYVKAAGFFKEQTTSYLRYLPKSVVQQLAPHFLDDATNEGSEAWTTSAYNPDADPTIDDHPEHEELLLALSALLKRRVRDVSFFATPPEKITSFAAINQQPSTARIVEGSLAEALLADIPAGLTRQDLSPATSAPRGRALLDTGILPTPAVVTTPQPISNRAPQTTVTTTTKPVTTVTQTVNLAPTQALLTPDSLLTPDVPLADVLEQVRVESRSPDAVGLPELTKPVVTPSQGLQRGQTVATTTALVTGLDPLTGKPLAEITDANVNADAAQALLNTPQTNNPLTGLSPATVGYDAALAEALVNVPNGMVGLDLKQPQQDLPRSLLKTPKAIETIEALRQRDTEVEWDEDEAPEGDEAFEVDARGMPAVAPDLDRRIDHGADPGVEQAEARKAADRNSKRKGRRAAKDLAEELDIAPNNLVNEDEKRAYEEEAERRRREQEEELLAHALMGQFGHHSLRSLLAQILLGQSLSYKATSEHEFLLGQIRLLQNGKTEFTYTGFDAGLLYGEYAENGLGRLGISPDGDPTYTYIGSREQADALRGLANPSFGPGQLATPEMSWWNNMPPINVDMGNIHAPDFSNGGADRYNYGIPASIRHNNPGATYPAPWMRDYGMIGADRIGGGHLIAHFPTMLHGLAANIHLSIIGYAGLSIEQHIAKWSGGHNSGAYANFVAKAVGLPPNTIITKDMMLDPNFMHRFMGAKFLWENGPAKGLPYWNQITPEHIAAAINKVKQNLGIGPPVAATTVPPVNVISGTAVSIGDSLAVGMAMNTSGLGQVAKGGIQPQAILQNIKDNAAALKDKDIILSTGASNGRVNLEDTIRSQIAALQDAGVKSITIIGVGPSVGQNVNDRIRAVAEAAGLEFVEPNANMFSGDGVHPTGIGYKDLVARALGGEASSTLARAKTAPGISMGAG